MKSTYILPLSGGTTAQVDCYIKSKVSALGVHRRIIGGEVSTGWTVTHLASGARAYPKTFRLRAAAVTAMLALDPENSAWALVTSPNMNDEVKAAICPLFKAAVDKINT